VINSSEDDLQVIVAVLVWPCMKQY